MGHCVVMGGALSCLVWGTVLVMGGTWSCNGLSFFAKQSPNGWGHCLAMCVGDGLAMDEAWFCNGLDFFFKQSPNGWDTVL